MSTRRSYEQFRSALGSLRNIAPVILLVSAIVNVLALTGSIYMMQVYDRVLTSRNVATLVALSLLVLGLFLFQGALEAVRGQLLVRLASRLERNLTGKVHDAVLRLRYYTGAQADAMQPVRDLDTVRSFLSGQGPVAILDMPWMPIFLAFVFMLHPVMGWITIAGAVFLVGVTLATERLVRLPTKTAALAARERLAAAEATDRNSDVLRAMGFGHRFARRFAAASERSIAVNARLTDIVGAMAVTSKVFRMMLQSMLLGVGAYLTIRGDMSGGAIIACSIAASRALAPVEIAISHWRAFVAARQAAERLDAVLATLPMEADPIALEPPTELLSVEAATVLAPGTQTAVLRNATFEVKAGQILAVIGPSAAGKSSLARMLTALWPVGRGAVRLDGATLDRWTGEARGRHIGYLPQDVQLFAGTVAENIARFEDNPDSRTVLAAARAAGVHEMVLRLPDGYETEVGHFGAAFSAGQRQRIGLARALYGDPFLVVLDEPNSNLDADGDAALTRALEGVKARRGIAVVIAHRPSVLAVADLVAVVGGGQITAFGAKDEVLRKAVRQPPGSDAAAAAANKQEFPARARSAAREG